MVFKVIFDHKDDMFAANPFDEIRIVADNFTEACRKASKKCGKSLTIRSVEFMFKLN